MPGGPKQCKKIKDKIYKDWREGKKNVWLFPGNMIAPKWNLRESIENILKQGHIITPVKLFLFLQASGQGDKWFIDTMTISRRNLDVQEKAYMRYATSLPTSNQLTQVNGEINQIHEQYQIIWIT